MYQGKNMNTILSIPKEINYLSMDAVFDAENNCFNIYCIYTLDHPSSPDRDELKFNLFRGIHISYFARNLLSFFLCY